MYFDGGLIIGRDPKYGLKNYPKTALEKLKLYSAEVALITHFEAIFFDMHSGNEKTLECAKSNADKFIPMAVINPLHFDPKSTYLNEIRKKGFKGINLYANLQYWTSDQYSFGHLAEALDKLGLPAQVCVANPEQLNKCVQVFKKSKIPVLIRWMRGGGYNFLSDEIAIAKDFKNFYFDVSNHVSYGEIEFLAKRIGSDRLYFASNSPLVYEACPYLMIESANLKEVDFENIAFNTLAKIFAITKTVKNKIKKPVSKLYDQVISRKKIDSHWHFEGWDILEPKKDLASALEIFDKCGYEKVVCSSILALNFDMSEGNLNAAKTISEHRNLYGYIVVDPRDSKKSLEELEKYRKNSKFVGIKTIQDYYGISLSDKSYEPILKWASVNNYPLLSHINGVTTVAKKFKKLKLIAAHCTLERLGDLADFNNVYIDITGSYAHRSETNLKTIIETVGDKRVLFGSDGPLISPFWTIGKIVETNLSSTSLERIFYKNAYGLFKFDK